VEARLDHVVLHPHDPARPRVAHELRHPRDRRRVLPVPPVALAGTDLHVVHVAARIGALQRRQPLAPRGSHLVAVERPVERAHLDRERQVAQPVGHGLVRVPGHHRRGREAVGHAR
ncbi:MAG: hypothetical protein ACK55I_47275, partial [bacterium]